MARTKRKGGLCVTKLHRGYVIHASDSEMGILRLAFDVIEAGDTDAFYPLLDRSEKTAWNRRTKDGEFLRTDQDRRKAK